MNILKPPGITSFGTVAWLRRILDIRKVGHTGTLDPLAAGVLPICVGKGTKIIQFLPEGEKEYIFELKLGQSTDTLDLEGEITAESENWKDLTEAEIITVIKSFIGPQEQVPPMYSAISYNGKRLYQLAREGKEVEREARDINIFSLDILEMQLPFVRIKTRCSRGTYIRSLVRDIGQRLSAEAVMSFLLRTASGPFKLEETWAPGEVEDIVENEQDASRILSNLTTYLELPELKIIPEAHIKATNGTELFISDLVKNNFIENLEHDQKIILYGEDNLFISICKVNLEEEFSLEHEKVFNIKEN
ncbi:MAG: tRNA pseudouridine(55) synthase TruB [Bacillota bacterium]